MNITFYGMRGTQFRFVLTTKLLEKGGKLYSVVMTVQRLSIFILSKLEKLEGE